MLNIFLLKTLCQLSLYFVTVRLMADIMELRLAHAGTVALCTFALWISFCLRNKSWYWRVMPLLLLGGLVPFASTADWLFIIVPMLLYALYIAIKRRYTIDNDTFRSIARIGVGYMAVMSVVSAFSDGSGAGFLLFATVCGIALSRDLRHDASTLEDPVYRKMSLAIFVTIIGGVLFVNSGVMRRITASIIHGIWWLYYAFFSLFRGELPLLDESIYFDIDLPYGPDGEDADYITTPHFDVTDSDPTAFVALRTIFLIAMSVIGISIFIYVCIKAAKIFLAYGKQSDGHALQREQIGDSTRKQKSAPQKLTGYSGTVRRYYRRFIKLITKNGAHLSPCHTSQDLTDISVNTLGDGGQDLRNVYIRARYSAGEITKEDTIKAKDALRRLKSSKGASNA